MRKAAPSLALVFILGIRVAGAEGPKHWWQELPSRVLLEMKCADFELAPPPPWRLRAGNLKLAEDPLAKGAAPQAVLEAQGRVELCAGGADWERYAVTAEVQLTTPRSAVVLAAATAEEGKEMKAGYQLEVRAHGGDKFRLLASASSHDGDLLSRVRGGKRTRDWLTLWARPDLNALAAQPWSDDPKAREAALRRLQAEFAGAAPWDDRWLRLRIELTERQARLWADGLLVDSADWPQWTKGA